MSEQNNLLLFAILVVAICVGALFVSVAYTNNVETPSDRIQTFESADQFSNYTTSQNLSYGFIRPTPFIRSDTSGDSAGSTSYDTRQTNTQVVGIDEPDIVKLTQGAAYYSPESRYYTTLRPDISTDLIYPEPPVKENQTTSVIGTENTEDPEVVDEIDHNGKMLREDDLLVIYNRSQVIGYNISDGTDPVQVWDRSIPSNTSVETARMMDDSIFFVLQTQTSECPVKPVENRTIDCDDIYYPTDVDQGTGVFTALTVAAESGDVRSTTSFLGSRDSTVYMTQDDMYVSYQQEDMMINEFINSRLDDIDVSDQIKQDIRDQDLDDINTKYEFRITIRDTIGETQNKTRITDRTNTIYREYQEYLGENQRQLQQTVIMKLNIEEGMTTPQTAGTVPGQPLNQYSFDEHDGNLRVATTVEGHGEVQSANDMYVLDENLNIQGSVQNMAEGQRVYAVRFIGEKGYIITFRQVDPLHVMDISDPENPEEVGVLELPGFSDYLHKVSDDRIMGVGESQDRNAKVVLFNVSDDTEPTVADSLIFEGEYSTEISEDYRAFLEDEEKGVYYLPASSGVRVVEVENDQLMEAGFIETPSSAERVRIVGDDLYVFHSNGVMSVDRETYNINNNQPLN